MSLTPRQKAAIAAAILLTALGGAWTGFDWDGAEKTALVSDLLQTCASLFGMALSLVAARQMTGRHRVTWISIASLCLLTGAGDVVMVVGTIISGQAGQIPTLANLLFLISLVPAMVGVGSVLPTSLHTSMRTILDLVIFTLALCYLSWLAILRPIYAATPGNTIDRISSLIVPVFDLLFIVAIIYIVILSPMQLRRAMSIMGFAVSVSLVTNTIESYMVLLNTYHEGSLLDIGWILAFALMGVAAEFSRNWPRQLIAIRPDMDRWIVYLPYFPVSVVALVTAILLMTQHHLDGILTIMGFALIALLIIRQLITVDENQQQNQTLAQLADTLRASEEHFRQLVNRSSDITLIVGETGMIEYASPSLEQLLQLSEEELKLKTLTDLITDVPPEELTTFLVAGDDVTMTWSLPISDGSQHYLEAIATDLRKDPAINGIVINARDVTERRKLEDQLRYQAFHDSLTGLPNRYLFRDRLSHAVEQQKRNGSLLALLFIDLDDFKAVNDGYGHEAGDNLLKEISKRLSSALRTADTAARLGGDEFAIILENVDQEVPNHVAVRVLKAINEPAVIGGTVWHPTASIGIAIIESGDDVDTILHAADTAMYKGKAEGKNRIMSSSVRNR